MDYNNIYGYITSEENNYKIDRVPITDGWEWNMFEHIKKSSLYKNSKFYKGDNDGLRPFKNIVRPILNVAYRSEGFDVKDIEPFVDDQKNYYKSFLVRKYHAKWAREHSIDTFIDDLVESYVDYGGVLVKNVGGVRPEVVPLQRLAFADQTDILSGNICEKHEYSIDQLREMKGKWDDDAIEAAIAHAENEKHTFMAGDNKAKTPGKYIEVYELHGMFPKSWVDEEEVYEDKPNEYTRQVHICCYYVDDRNAKQGITLFKGPENKQRYKFLARDKIFGRALGMGGVEELFEAQTWTNYSEIKIKAMLDKAGLMLLQTADQAYAGRNNINDLSTGEVLTTEENKPITQVAMAPSDVPVFERTSEGWEQNAMVVGSANEALLGVSPSSGTPFRLQALVTQEGKGLHDYRRGKIATFVGEIYRDWILDYLVKEMNKGQTFVSELSVDELQEIAETVVNNVANKKIKQMVMSGKPITDQEIEIFKQLTREQFVKGGSKRFMEVVKDELKSLPVDVEINVAGKQKGLAERADKLTNIFREIIANPQVMQVPGAGKLFNEIIESSGFSPIDFTQFTKPIVSPIQEPQLQEANAPQQ